SKGLPTRGVSSPNEPQWFRLLCLSLVVMRCQPLRRALVSLRKIHQKFKLKALKNQRLAFNLHNLAFEFLTMMIRLNELKVQLFQSC
ncbi:hypothetical protein, partial [Vibrio cholerae]|uniref:hypothetical protein n=1 Tax=Vibrio cholerae TaxID=666 RepID=UPI002934873D